MTSEIETLTVMIDEDPNDAWLYYERGWAYYDAGKKPLSLQDFSKAIVLDDREPAFWMSRGFIYDATGFPASSLRDLNRAVELDPDDAEYYSIRGRLYFERYEYRAAIFDFDRAIKQEPLDPEYRSRRAAVLLRMGEWDRALEDYDEAIRLNPDEANAYYERALALIYYNPRDRPLDGLPDLEAAIRLDPAATWYREVRGYIRFYLERWAEAAEDFACQDVRFQYRLWPAGGSTIASWLYLARLFQGEEEAGMNAVKEYLEWYVVTSGVGANARPIAERMQCWPVPLARLLAGEIDELELSQLPSLDLNKPGLVECEVHDIEEGILQSHFVIGEQLLARGRQSEALPHLKKACSLPAADPMRWIAAKQTGCP